MKKVLTIAGSDSGGGAGIQADLKSLAARGVYGMSAITALTAQNTVGVQGIFTVSPDFVEKQIDSIMNDIGADAWKTGMLVNKDIIKVVVKKALQYDVKFLVVDPVMIAKSGDLLLKPDAIKTLKEDLIPISYIITPNHHEAEELTGMKIENLDDAYKASIELHSLGAKNVVVKGGHLTTGSKAIDVLFDGAKSYIIESPRIPTKNTHGTGCTYASAIAAEIAKGNHIYNAVKIAKEYLTETIKKADEMNIGAGHGPLNHFLGKNIEI
ncbi:MAG: bifunctional hydroxymethylpyrimidine kinase/phosphomethylpyrimidine kinase [Candidatus Lokiarchaeota archaeon]